MALDERRESQITEGVAENTMGCQGKCEDSRKTTSSLRFPVRTLTANASSWTRSIHRPPRN